MGTTGKSPPLRLRVRVLSGSCLPKPRGHKSGEHIDPYINVTLHDMVADEETLVFRHTETKHSTATISDNGFCPVWNETNFTEFDVHSPDTAMIHFSLMEADVGKDDKIGDSAIPVNKLRMGYRSVQLFDKNHTRTGPFRCASLFVEIRTVN